MFASAAVFFGKKEIKKVVISEVLLLLFPLHIRICDWPRVNFLCFHCEAAGRRFPLTLWSDKSDGPCNIHIMLGDPLMGNAVFIPFQSVHHS